MLPFKCATRRALLQTMTVWLACMSTLVAHHSADAQTGRMRVIALVSQDVAPYQDARTGLQQQLAALPGAQIDLYP